MSLRIAVEIDGVLAHPESGGAHQAGSAEDFWERLTEFEPGAVARLAGMAESRRWEVIFLTDRPPTPGATAQIQSQRWLESKGFILPSVYVVRGSRGRVAAALDLDLVIDAAPEHAAEVVEDSGARAILVWRFDRQALPVEAHRADIKVVGSTADCLDVLNAMAGPTPRDGFLTRVRRMLGLKESKA